MIAATYGRTGELRATLDRAKDRALKCEREFDRFSSGADLSTADAQRQHRQLKADGTGRSGTANGRRNSLNGRSTASAWKSERTDDAHTAQLGARAALAFLALMLLR
ncbi:MAG TPA: hypothetical protein VEW64_02040 [Methyloceanibacter sp.]|jgi:hypothetical protein|nr:hypothetical protein [Methyloceanibacter sp.]